jgi:hypothetical protein
MLIIAERNMSCLLYLCLCGAFIYTSVLLRLNQALLASSYYSLSVVSRGARHTSALGRTLYWLGRPTYSNCR